VKRGVARHIRIHNDTAFSLQDGTAPFGIDVSHSTGSSLVIGKRSRDGGSKVGNDRQVTVRTVDAVSYLRSLTADHVALKLDVEGAEYTIAHFSKLCKVEQTLFA